jgi:predicted 2-oxoglutarate/Fe(II)-dependent dioxygenase YbiX
MAIELIPGMVSYEFPEMVANNCLKHFKKVKDDDWMPALVGASQKVDHVRSNLILNVDDVPVISQQIRKYLYDCVKSYTEYYEIKVQQDEGLNILKYNQYDKYEYHTDSNWDSYRTVSCLIYLNPDEYSGGETHFKHFDYSVSPKEPTLVLFPSDYAFLHAAKPVNKGSKYIIVTWMNDMPKQLMGNSCACSR